MQRKVFRVEQMLASRRPAVAAEQRRLNDEIKASLSQRDADTPMPGDAARLKAELALMRDSIARQKRDLGRLIGDGKERRMARAADELSAAVSGMESATLNILKSIESIDDSAKALAASMQDDYSRGLSHEIQDHVVKIYELCNFQDLAGQRIGKGIAALNAIEEQVSAMIAQCDGMSAAPGKSANGKLAASKGLLNGPKLNGDLGHASQHDIDKMFGT